MVYTHEYIFLVVPEHDLEVLKAVRVPLAPEGLLHDCRLPLLYLQDTGFNRVGDL